MSVTNKKMEQIANGNNRLGQTKSFQKRTHWKKINSQAAKNNFFCNVCKINVHTEAEYALHEFSKKHCDNLVRIAKNKPVIVKQKSSKSEQLPVKETPKHNIVTTHGSIAKYGYFVPGKIYETAVESKEFNTEYDPYSQKYAETTYKGAVQVPVVKPTEMALPATETRSSLKRKKKKIRLCQLCNVTLSTVPEYEAHMRSPQHAWKLKMSGMGVSAHFVKASTDLHTVEVEEKTNEKDKTQDSGVEAARTNSFSTVFPLLYCDICELLLNSEQQFNAHVNGKSHNDNVQRKAEIKSKKQQLESPSPDQLYCFSCKVALNNLYQYNEHKYGKKHKTKCRRLMKEGITIPPEERVASWGIPKLDPNKPVVYPELYEKFILERDKKTNSVGKVEEKPENVSCDPANTACKQYCCENCNQKFSDFADFQLHVNNEEHVKVCSESSSSQDKHVSKMIFREADTTQKCENVEVNASCNAEEGKLTEESGGKNKDFELCIIGVNDFLKCSLCCQNFKEQADFEYHLTTEDHARKIVELKDKELKDDEILVALLKDKNVVKPDKLGRYSCTMCSITAGHAEEFAHHLSTIVHKQSVEENKIKRNLEIKFAVNPDENGKFTCKLCRESRESLVEYNQHLLTGKHRDSIKAEKTKKVMTKKKSLLKRVKQKYIISGLKRKDFACWRKKCEKNPGVRTKVTGTATDLCTGLRASVPNLEVLEPKIDSTKNVTIGTSEGVGTKRKVDDQGNRRNKRNRPDRGVPEPYRFGIKPLMATPFPPRPPPRIPLRHSRPPNLMHPRNWVPYPPIHHFRPNSFHQRSMFPVTRYQRPPNFRPAWPRYPPCNN